MNERLIEKIAKIIYANSEYSGCERSTDETAAEIAAMIEAERKPDATAETEYIEYMENVAGFNVFEKSKKATAKPDTLTVPEAVERLVEFFSGGVVEVYRGYTMWFMNIRISGDDPEPSCYEAIVNGNRTPAAVKVGLEDLFVTILGGEK